MLKASYLFATLLLLPALVSAQTLNNGNIYSRDTSESISFNDLSFSGLDATHTDVLQFNGQVGASGTFHLSGYTTGAAPAVTAGSGITISNVLAGDTSNDAYWTATIVGATNQSVTESWSSLQTTAGATLTTGVSANGLTELEFDATSHDLLAAGGNFVYSVGLPGNWSTLGTNTGDVQFLGVNSGFTMIQNFVYNAQFNTTTVEVADPNYTTGKAVGLDFILLGSPVPESATASLMLAGLALLGLHKRRKA